MTDEPLETVCLDNRCKLEIYDSSIKMTADRWKISLVARLTVPVDDSVFQDGPDMPATPDEIRQVLGPETVFEMKKERIFVDDAEKAMVFDELLQVFKKDTLSYLALPVFPGKYIIKRYREETGSR